MGATATVLKEACRRVDECRSERANLVGRGREEVVGLPMEEEGLESQSFQRVTATSELNTLRTDRVIFFLTCACQLDISYFYQVCITL